MLLGVFMNKKTELVFQRVYPLSR